MLPEIEKREFPVKFEVRKEGEAKKITGHAAVFDTLSVEMWGFREQIQKGAFLESIKKDDIRALFNHDPNFILGRNRAGTLKLEEDRTGLFYELEPPDTQLGRDLVTSIERGDVSQNSFAFTVLNDDWDEDEKGTLIRTLTKVKLYDVSPVVYPAYPETDIKLRSLEGLAEMGRERIEQKKADDGWWIESKRKRLDMTQKIYLDNPQ